MQSTIVKFRVAFLLVAAVVLVYTSGASAQTERRPSEDTIQVGAVNERSPAVDLKTVGKVVAPGVLEVDPGSVRGKRIKVSSGGEGARHACIGKYDKAAGTCKGIYIEW